MAFPGIATLTAVSPKKRNSRKPKTHRQGLSGNPQLRAQQLQERRARGQPAFGQLPREPLADPDRAAFRELAYRLAGGAPDEAWWRESHERILARARALTWPSRLVDLETQACQLVGDEFYDRLQSPETGLHPAQWLRALAGGGLRRPARPAWGGPGVRPHRPDAPPHRRRHRVGPAGDGGGRGGPRG